MNRQILVDNQWVTFLEDKFVLPNGADCTYYHSQKSDAIMAIAIEVHEHVCASREIVSVGDQQLEQLEHGLVCKKSRLPKSLR